MFTYTGGPKELTLAVIIAKVIDPTYFEKFLDHKKKNPNTTTSANFESWLRLIPVMFTVCMQKLLITAIHQCIN